MTEKTNLDTSKLLGFDNAGDAIWSIADADTKTPSINKPSGVVKPAGDIVKY